MTSRGINDWAIDKFKLGHTGSESRFPNRLAIPYLTPAGPWHIKYRCIDHANCNAAGHKEKYIYDAGVEQTLFNAQTLNKAERVVVVEGELDAISVEAAGIAAVAYPGADTWKRNKFWRWCFDSCTEVIIVADGDEPREGHTHGVGEEAAMAVSDSLRDSLPSLLVRVVVMPIGHDANSFLNEYGDIDFLDTIGVL